MDGKYLGKISHVKFGIDRDYPHLFGLFFGFEFSDYHITDGGRYTVNNHAAEFRRESAAITLVNEVEDILKTAKVNYVDELKGKPVMVTIEDNLFKDFRILTEVL